MGKTNMALNVLRDVLVQETFGHRRFFVRCAGATSVELLEVAIARCLRIRTSGVHPRTTIRAAIEAELQMSPALLVLDSLESIFRVIVTIQSAQAELQALLYGLTMIPGVSLIVTLRGVIKPAGLEWHQVPLLGPIDVPSARRLFLSIAPGHQQEPDLIDLLEYVDRQPLPIRLLAHQAAMEPSLVYVVGQWEAACGGALIRKGRMEEFPPVLRVSLELAWDSLKLDALSRELGSLIALLPQGADVVDIDTLVDDIDACSSSSSLCCLPWYCAGSCSRGITTAKGRHAAARLVACGLAFLDETHARLRMLAPVREFITCHHPPSRLEFDVLVSRFLFVLQLGGLPLWPAVAIPYAESDSISRLIQKEALNLNFILTKAFQCPANKSQIRVMLLTLKHSRHLAYLASHEFESLIWTATHAAVNAREFKLATDIVLLWAPLLACETVNYQDALSFAQRAKDMCREREARLALADNILDSFGRESEAEFAIDLEPNICKSGNRSRSRSAGQPGSAASPAEGQPQSPRATAAAHEDVSHLFRAEMFLQSLLEQRQPESQHPSFSVTSPIATNQAARAHRSLARFSSLLGRDQDAQIHLMKALQLADRRATLNLTFERSPATVRVLAVDEEEEETEREGEVGKQEGNEGFRASCHIQLGDIFFRRAVFSEDESPHADDAGAHERERESALEHYLLAREICTNLTATGTAPGSTHPHTHAHTSKHANANPIEMKCRAARANFRLASLYLYDAYDGSSQFVGDVATGTPTAGGTATRTAAGTGTGGRASAAILAGLAYLRELDGECCEGHPTAYSHTPPIAQLHPPSGHSSHSGQSQSPASLLSDVLDHFERYVVDLDWLDASLSPSGGRGGGRRAEGRERGRANANPGRSAKAVQGEWERVGLGFFVNALLREAELARLEGVLE